MNQKASPRIIFIIFFVVWLLLCLGTPKLLRLLGVDGFVLRTILTLFLDYGLFCCLSFMFAQFARTHAQDVSQLKVESVEAKLSKSSWWEMLNFIPGGFEELPLLGVMLAVGSISVIFIFFMNQVLWIEGPLFLSEFAFEIVLAGGILKTKKDGDNPFQFLIRKTMGWFVVVFFLVLTAAIVTSEKCPNSRSFYSAFSACS